MTVKEFYSRRGSVFGFSEEYGRDDDGDLIFHAGQDIRADAGDPIPFPGATGRVSVVGYGVDAGWFTSIAVEGQYHQFYHQIQRPSLEVGQLLTFGDIVGAVGSTGKSSGPHLHYAVSSNPYPGPGGNRVDPWPIIQRMLAANGSSAAGGVTPYSTFPTGADNEMTIFYKPTSNSSPLNPADPTSSRIWAGAHEIGGILYSDIWGVSDSGEGRRLTRKQWVDIYALAVARGVAGDLNKATFECHGNELEQILFGLKL